MWLMTPNGFYSTVITDDGKAMVRGRWKEDLEAFVRLSGTDSPVLETLHADYPFRVIVDSQTWAEFVRSEAAAIDYRNFKSEVTRRQGRDRHDVYMDVWSAIQRGARKRGSSTGRPVSDPGGRLDT